MIEKQEKNMFKQKKYAAGSFDSGYHGLSFESFIWSFLNASRFVKEDVTLYLFISHKTFVT